MAATITNPQPITCAPGNTVSIVGSGFGVSPTATIDQQTATRDQIGIVAPGSGSNDTTFQFVVPDKTWSGNLTITATDASKVIIPIIVATQYLQAYEYVGQGVDITALAAGELDAILRDASSYADVWMGLESESGGMMIRQTQEDHAWRSLGNEKSRRIAPFRRHIVSVDSFIVRISSTQLAIFPTTDIIINDDQHYIELLSYSVASYVLLGAIQNLGLSANIARLIYTAGYPYLAYPPALKNAVKMIATELLTYRKLQFDGLGGLSSVKQGNQAYQRRSESFEIPKPALQLLRPFAFRTFA